MTSYPKSVKVGEGAYGCVHLPSLPCTIVPEVPGFNYSDYVSKLMKNKHADLELSEYTLLNRIDPTNKYHLGTPLQCNPNIEDEEVRQAINECKNLNKEDVFRNIVKYKLII